ncbi:MAG: hypothetical protein Q4P71_07890 [Actinomycetaceae bacterium]|nr:hypothetical protein [Actinomycetaceae bacterium]
MKPQVIDLRGFGSVQDLHSQDTPAIQVSRHLAIMNLPFQSPARNKILQRVRTRVTLENSGPETYASLDSACLVYGIPIMDPSPHVNLIVRTKHTRRPTVIGAHLNLVPPSRVHRRNRDLPDEAFTQVGGEAVLAPEYLIIDQLSRPSLDRAIVNADAAFAHFCRASNFQRERTINWFRQMIKQIKQIVESGKIRHCRRRILRRLRYVSPLSQSPAETLLRIAMIRAGLPNPVEQFPFHAGRSTGFVDFAWPDFGIGFEMDGKLKYTSPDVLVAERVREQDARRILPQFFRWMWDDLSDRQLTKRLRKLFPRNALSQPRRVW